MAKCDFEKKLELHTILGDFVLQEEVVYPNGGRSLFYVFENCAIVLDDGICDWTDGETIFEYSLITSKQNAYVDRYERLFRFLAEDIKEDAGLVDEYLQRDLQEPQIDYTVRVNDRANLADATPLEMFFEKHFSMVYGSDSVKYLWKEYGITDEKGRARYLDYFVRTANGDIAVEENGVSYHHPQIIGKQRYREQLAKQNACTASGIKLFRFSSEDCRFSDRFEDDIKMYFGKSTEGFQESGMLVDRTFALYEHQESTLQDIREQRASGVKSFLIVFPTASGKSKIVEEDIKAFAAERANFRGLVLVPNTAVRDDWHQRILQSLPEYESVIEVVSYAFMERHFKEYETDAFDYIVVDEAHHAVAPGLKRTVQYFDPAFLIGLTATDQRPDKKRLETVFGAYRVGLSLTEAMEWGIVARARAYRIETNIDLSHVRINGREYVNADLERSIRVSSRNELIVHVLQEYFTEGKAGTLQGVVFCVNVKHANEMARLMNEAVPMNEAGLRNGAGLTAQAYTGETRDRERVMKDFREKRIRFLCTCQMISEGWDYPELGILVMARPTLSKVLYLQQLGRGLRKTAVKKHVFVIDVVDSYGSMVMPCSLHSIFKNPYYVPFGDIAERGYAAGDMIEVDGISERVERIVEIDVQSFDEKYGDYLSQEQLAREFFVSTGTVTSWIHKGKIRPTVSFPFGSKQLYMFSREDASAIREELNLPEHSDETIRDDFFEFLEQRDYSMSYKMPFLIGLIGRMDASGDARIDDVLSDYIEFYADRLQRGLDVDRAGCPYTEESLQDRASVKRSMLTNPFEKFERKRFLYYSKDLGVISMNHALHSRLTAADYERILHQMKADLTEYYGKM